MNDHTPPQNSELARQLGIEAARRPFWSRGRVLAMMGVVLVLVAGFVFFLARGRSGQDYVFTQVMRGPLTVTVSATGSLQPETEVSVGAEVSGRIDAVNVDFNDPVTKDEILAVINTDQIRAQLAQARASLSAARANVVTSEATVKETELRRTRARALFARGGVSAQDQQTAEADYDRAVATLAKAKADVENAAALVASHQTTLGKAAIRSPIDGIVLDRKVEPGQTVAASFQTPVLFTLASDLSRMQLQVDIDEADVGNVREGQVATFSVDAYPQRRFDAKLIALRNAPKTDNGVVTYQGVLAVDNSALLLRPGLTATVDILVSEAKDVLLVPNGALRFTPPTRAVPAPPPPPSPAANGGLAGRVWVLEGTKPVVRDLVIGHSDGRNTEVLSGNLAVGERVITDIAIGRNGA
jgi:HlyD family secretion protein